MSFILLIQCQNCVKLYLNTSSLNLMSTSSQNIRYEELNILIVFLIAGFTHDINTCGRNEDLVIWNCKWLMNIEKSKLQQHEFSDSIKSLN